MGDKGQKVALRIAGIGAGVVLLASSWTGAALADDPIIVDPGDSSPVTETTSAPTRTSTPTRPIEVVVPPRPIIVGDKNCRDFPSQAAAQAYFTSIGGSPTNNANNLDADNDGIACEDYNYGNTGGASGGGGTPGGTGVAPAGDKNCPDFPSQAAAQAYFTSIGGSAMNNANNLDADNDGIACEDENYISAGTASSSMAGALDAAASAAQVSVVPSGGVNTGDGSFTR